MPAFVYPLYKFCLTPGGLENLFNRLSKRYRKTNDEIYTVQGIDVHTYYSNQSKVRFFYVLDLENKKVCYYAQLSLGNTRNVFAPEIKTNFQSLVYTDDFFGSTHRGFAQDVIYQVMFPKYISTLLVTDKDQTEAGFHLWKRLVSQSYLYNTFAGAYIFDAKTKRRFVAKLEKDNLINDLNTLEYILFGDEYLIHSNRGFFISKLDFSNVLDTKAKISVVSIDELVEIAKTL